jgi:DNA replication protein DnaC
VLVGEPGTGKTHLDAQVRQLAHVNC